MITNDWQAAQCFVGDIPGEVITKALGPGGITDHGQVKVAYTRRLSAEDLAGPVGISVTATTLQRFVPKAFEVRLTVIGQQMFPIAIHASTEAARTDWRCDAGSQHRSPDRLAGSGDRCCDGGGDGHNAGKRHHMTVLIEGRDWASRAAALAEELVAAGKLSSPEWHKAVLEVPRHVFVPSYYVHRDGGMVAAGATDEQGRAQWLDTVYSNTALITKLAQDTAGIPPVFLSSSSTPGLMTRMLETLDVHDEQRVLEIGTGTGYNAALLSHRLGAANVFSIDIEPDLIDLARTRLAELGYHPTLVAGDGAAGLPEHVPFDRIIATCSVPAIPWAWVEQTTLGGIILTDIKLGLNAGNLLRLTRTCPHRAEGRFEAGQAAFMHLRHTPGFDGRVPYTRAPHDNPITEHTTTLDPRTPWTNPVVWFLTALRIGPHYRLGYTGSNPRHGPDAVCLSTPDGSRSEITLTPNTDGSHTVHDTGHARLWSHLEDAHHLWDAAGRPDWPRLGLAVTPQTQTLYADEPGNTIAIVKSETNQEAD